MPLIQAQVDCPVFDSFRVQQIAGLFDVPLAERCRESFEVEIPALDDDWSIGVIVGPSGSGKSTVARAAFGDALYTPREWPRTQAVIDGFGEDLSTKEITAMLTAVGFSSPPSWIKPYQVLSNGERFRCDLARALLQANRSRSALRVPRSASKKTRKWERGARNEAPAHRFPWSYSMSSAPSSIARLRKSVLRRFRRRCGIVVILRCAVDANRRFIAVTCHYDVVPWLEPDWVVDMATRELRWGRLRRPDIVLEVVECPQAAWRLFARHHYLSGDLARAVDLLCRAVARRAGGVLRHHRHVRPRGAQTGHADCCVARLPRAGDRPAFGRASVRARATARLPREHHGQPSLGDRPLQALAAVGGAERETGRPALAPNGPRSQGENGRRPERGEFRVRGSAREESGIGAEGRGKRAKGFDPTQLAWVVNVMAS